MCVFVATWAPKGSKNWSCFCWSVSCIPSHFGLYKTRQKNAAVVSLFVLKNLQLFCVWWTTLTIHPMQSQCVPMTHQVSMISFWETSQLDSLSIILLRPKGYIYSFYMCVCVRERVYVSDDVVLKLVPSNKGKCKSIRYQFHVICVQGFSVPFIFASPLFFLFLFFIISLSETLLGAQPWPYVLAHGWLCTLAFISPHSPIVDDPFKRDCNKRINCIEEVWRQDANPGLFAHITPGFLFFFVFLYFFYSHCSALLNSATVARWYPSRWHKMVWCGSLFA